MDTADSIEPLSVKPRVRAHRSEPLRANPPRPSAAKPKAKKGKKAAEEQKTKSEEIDVKAPQVVDLTDDTADEMVPIVDSNGLADVVPKTESDVKLVLQPAPPSPQPSKTLIDEREPMMMPNEMPETTQEVQELKSDATKATEPKKEAQPKKRVVRRKTGGAQASDSRDFAAILDNAIKPRPSLKKEKEKEKWTEPEDTEEGTPFAGVHLECEQPGYFSAEESARLKWFVAGAAVGAASVVILRTLFTGSN
jgi:hypothetical protein